MPRYLRLIFDQAKRNWVVVVVLVVSLILALAYTRKTEIRQSTATAPVEIRGIAPAEDAGILGGLASQNIQVKQLQTQVQQLRDAISRMETQSQSKPDKDDRYARELKEEMRRLQSQVQRAKTPAASPRASAVQPTAPPAPEIVVRSIRRGTSGPQPARPPQRGIQVVAERPETDRPTAYLPPQSYAAGHVIDGYTGLASESGFPLTIAIDQPFLTANDHTVSVQGCRLGARATTEELTARSRAQLTNITCVDESGQTLEQPIEGYITAADNIHGGFAEVFWHEQELVKAFAKSAIPVALVSLFKETRRTISAASLTGVVSSTGNSVAQQVAGRMANIYLDKAEKLASPVVWVPPHTPVHIYITKGAALDPYVTHQSSAGKPPITATRLAR